MERGAVVIVSAQDDYGKPRPAVVVQSTRVIDLLESVTVCFMTSDLLPDGPFRITVEPTPENRLPFMSQIQVEKMTTFSKSKVRGLIGLVLGSLEGAALT